MKLDLNSKIGDLLKSYPESYEVFSANGFKANSPGELVESLGRDTMLKTVLAVAGINPELFLGMIEEKLKHGGELELEYELYDPSLPVNMLVQTPCPTRMLFKERATELLKQYELETGEKLNCFVVDGCGAPYEHQELWREADIDKLPDIIMSKGFDEFYNQEFIRNHIETGNYKNLLEDISPEFKSIGCLDEAYTLSSAMVKVMMVDQNRLGELPTPKRWEDLLNPIYKDQIVAFGTERGISKLTLHHIYKEFGAQGIEKFAANVKAVQHGAKMAKIAGTNSGEAGGIYVLPLTFAKICEANGVSIVWPEDGGTILPMAILVKADKVDKLKNVIEFLLQDYGQMCVDINALSLSPKVKNDVPEGTKFRWLGWDYVKSNDVVAIGERIKADFHEIWDKK